MSRRVSSGQADVETNASKCHLLRIECVWMCVGGEGGVGGAGMGVGVQD